MGLPADIGVDRPHSEWLLMMRGWTKSQIGDVLLDMGATQGARQAAALHKLAGDSTGTPADCKLAVTAMSDIVNRIEGKVQDGPSVLVQQNFNSDTTVTTHSILQDIERVLAIASTDSDNPAASSLAGRLAPSGLRPGLAMPTDRLSDSEKA